MTETATAIHLALDAVKRDFDPASPATAQAEPHPKASSASPRAPPGRILLTREQVLVRCGISDATLRRRMASGLLPRPVELGNKYCLRWYSDELETAVAGLIRQSQPAANPQS